jgi:tetraacyldisaccharide 4'-kinase
MPVTNKWRGNVQRVMSEHTRHSFFSLASLLMAGSMLYAGGVRLRAMAYSRGWCQPSRLSRPVISVGNLTAGGTGKTPMTMHLAQLIVDLGYKPVILSRGYKGQYADKALAVGDGREVLAGAKLAGDEPYLMASLLDAVPVVVGRDRYYAGRLAIERFDPDLLLLDDGFQHLKLHRDLNLLLLDASQPFGNSHLLPRGPLREPAQALLRADAVVLTRSEGLPVFYTRLSRTLRPRPLFLAEHTPIIRGVVPAGISCTGDFNQMQWIPYTKIGVSRKHLVFSGLAHNDLFHRSIHKLGYTITETLQFDDHHAYRQVDVDRICTMATQIGAEGLITTDKDFVRIPKGSTFKVPLIISGVTMNITSGTTGWQEYMSHQLHFLVSKMHIQTA